MKKQIAIILIILVLAFFYLKENKKVFTIQDAENAIKYAKNKYGAEFARTFEQLLRLETNHFRSSQYINTGTGGLMVGKWGNRFKKAGVQPRGVWSALKDGKKYSYVILSSVNDFADFLFSYLRDHTLSDWNGGEVPDYIERVKKIKTPITDKL